MKDRVAAVVNRNCMFDFAHPHLSADLNLVVIDGELGEIGSRFGFGFGSLFEVGIVCNVNWILPRERRIKYNNRVSGE